MPKVWNLEISTVIAPVAPLGVMPGLKCSGRPVVMPVERGSSFHMLEKLEHPQ